MRFHDYVELVQVATSWRLLKELLAGLSPAQHTSLKEALPACRAAFSKTSFSIKSDLPSVPTLSLLPRRERLLDTYPMVIGECIEASLGLEDGHPGEQRARSGG